MFSGAAFNLAVDKCIDKDDREKFKINVQKVQNELKAQTPPPSATVKKEKQDELPNILEKVKLAISDHRKLEGGPVVVSVMLDRFEITESNSWDEIRFTHDCLKANEKRGNLVELIIKRRLGKLYNIMTHKAEHEKLFGEGGKTIIVWIEEKGLIYKRVRELILFYELIEIYPVLIMTCLSYNTFVRNHKKIERMIKGNKELEDGLMASVNLRYTGNIIEDIELNV